MMVAVHAREHGVAYHSGKAVKSATGGEEEDSFPSQCGPMAVQC